MVIVGAALLMYWKGRPPRPSPDDAPGPSESQSSASDPEMLTLLDETFRCDLMMAGVVAELRTAGLRGRGGAGFPTGRKWSLVRAEPAPRMFAVNADEGEPGTFKDRYYLERDAHRFIEGMLIAAWVVEGLGELAVVDHVADARALEQLVAADVVDAGLGDLCVMVRSREASLALPDEKFVPVDLALVGIVDELVVQPDNQFSYTLKKGWNQYT